MSIKMRLLALNKKQVDLLDEIRKRTKMSLQPTELSVFINSRQTTPKAKTVLNLCDEILTEWESAG